MTIITKTFHRKICGVCMGVAGCLKENSHFYYCFVIDIFNNKTSEGNNFLVNSGLNASKLTAVVCTC